MKQFFKKIFTPKRREGIELVLTVLTLLACIGWILFGVVVLLGDRVFGPIFLLLLVLGAFLLVQDFKRKK